MPHSILPVASNNVSLQYETKLLVMNKISIELSGATKVNKLLFNSLKKYILGGIHIMLSNKKT